jgi:hypothetical protein
MKILMFLVLSSTKFALAAILQGGLLNSGTISMYVHGPPNLKMKFLRETVSESY